jgi:hypothetical protein
MILTMIRTVMIGARCRRQGIGEYTARSLQQAGAQVVALVGTKGDSVGEARQTLLEKYQIECRGYSSVLAALREESPDLVVVSSPYAVHRQNLEWAAEAGAHCLCEKPLVWDSAAEQQEDGLEPLIDRFCRQGLLLDLVAQWPYTLPTYRELYPGLGSEPPKTFEMLMSPLSDGEEMVPDAAPHALSMLAHLCGPGEVEDVEASYPEGSAHVLQLRFSYCFEGGETKVTCTYRTTPERPRPAGYAIDGHWAHRQIQMPEYSFDLEGENGSSVPLPDPLQSLAEDFLQRVENRAPTDRTRLLQSVRGLRKLISATRAAEPMEG